MGMFDDYIPDPPLECPACGATLEGWQGKDGPNALMIWQQGVPGPIDQAIEDEEVKLEPERLAEFRLPDQFEIYTTCCGKGYGNFIEADCFTENQTWSRTELITADTAKQGKQERRDEFKARLRWLRGNNN